MKHIGVDGHLLCGKKTGMGTVVHEILKYWNADQATQITVFTPEELEETYEKMLIENGIEVSVLGNCNYFMWEQIVLPKAVKENNIDMLWCPYNTAPIRLNCKTIVTVHDVIYMSLPLKDAPSTYKKMGIIYRRRIVPIALKNAYKIITISKYAASEIVKYFPTSLEKISVIYNSADVRNDYLSEEEFKHFKIRHGIQKPYILGFGSLERRKNSLGLIRAYDALPCEVKEAYQLVLFGFRRYEESEEKRYIEAKGLQQTVVVMEYISDIEKNSLYKNGRIFVFPTISEGFGIPILEAFANGISVITSNVTAIPEVAGKGALLINPNCTSEITNAIMDILSDDKLRDKLISEGKKQLNKFSWKVSSLKLLKILRS